MLESTGTRKKNQHHQTALCLQNRKGKEKKQRKKTQLQRRGKPDVTWCYPQSRLVFPFFFRKELGFEVKREEQNDNKKKKNKKQRKNRIRIRTWNVKPK